MLSEALEREHREIDAGLSHVVAGQQGDDQLVVLQSTVAALRRHIYLEEEFLFPLLRRGRFAAAVMVMLREHGEIWQALDEFEHGLTGPTPFTDSSAVHERMARTLADHNEKEEAILYRAADEMLSESEQIRLKALLESGTMPEGWACQAVRASKEAPRDQE